MSLLLTHCQEICSEINNGLASAEYTHTPITHGSVSSFPAIEECQWQWEGF